MDCERAAELLPWLLNRTLEATEERQVEAHLKSCEKCRRELGETVFSATAARQHLPPEVLIDYGFERPVALDQDLVERHLASCPRCAEELDLVRECHRLAQGQGARVVRLDSRRPRTQRWRAGALAASLATLVAVGGWLWSWRDARQLRLSLAALEDGQSAGRNEELQGLEQRLAEARTRGEELRRQSAGMEEELARERAKSAELEQQVAALEGPQLNAWVVDVYPLADAVVRGSPPTANTYERPPDATRLELNLADAFDATYSDYEVELVDAAGRPFWHKRGLERQPAGVFHLKLPVGMLPPDRFEIRIYGLEQDRRSEAVRYESLLILSPG